MSVKKRKTKRTPRKTKASTKKTARRGMAVFLMIGLAGLLLVCLYLILNYSGSLFFSRNDHFETKTISIHSDGRLTETQLRRYAEVEEGANLFAIDMDTVRDNLMSSPLIESVRIQRDLPDTLNISVVERVAVAQIRWRRWGGTLLLDRSGVVLPPTRTGMALPVIDGLKFDRLRPGEQLDDPGVQYILELISACDTLGFGNQVAFKRFDLRYPDHINVKLEDGINARFPYHSASNKLVRLVTILQIDRERGTPRKLVDLVPDGEYTPTY